MSDALTQHLRDAEATVAYVNHLLTGGSGEDADIVDMTRILAVAYGMGLAMANLCGASNRELDEIGDLARQAVRSMSMAGRDLVMEELASVGDGGGDE